MILQIKAFLELLESAKCNAIISGDKKFAFVFGGSYGRD